MLPDSFYVPVNLFFSPHVVFVRALVDRAFCRDEFLLLNLLYVDLVGDLGFLAVLFLFAFLHRRITSVRCFQELDAKHIIGIERALLL